MSDLPPPLPSIAETFDRARLYPLGNGMWTFVWDKPRPHLFLVQNEDDPAP